MANTNSPREVTRAWLAGEKPNVRYASLYANGVRIGDTQYPALFSYGDHFVAAIQRAGGVWVNTEDYFPSYGERAAKGWIYESPRTPAYSPTTRRHLAGIEHALSDAGYSPCETVEIQAGPNGHAYRLWSNTYCEQCEEVAVPEHRRFCSPDCRAEFSIDLELYDGYYGGPVDDGPSDADPGL
jgi:hypothetical protein